MPSLFEPSCHRGDKRNKMWSIKEQVSSVVSQKIVRVNKNTRDQSLSHQSILEPELDAPNRRTCPDDGASLFTSVATLPADARWRSRSCKTRFRGSLSCLFLLWWYSTVELLVWS